MSKPEQDYTQPLGLDVGTSRIVVARATGKTYEYDAQLNAFVTLPYTRLAASLLERENVFHEVHGSDIVIAGNDAQKFAEIFHVETRRPMFQGVLNPSEPYSLVVIRQIFNKLIGRAAVEQQKVYFSIPAPMEEGADSIAYHRASVGQILAELGYSPTPIEEGLAVVFGELAESNFSGIGISCGSGLCNICLAMLSVPVISFSVGKAGDFIDNRAAAVTGELATRLRVWKEQSFRLIGLNGDRVQNAFTVYYGEMIGHLAEVLRDRVASQRQLPKFDQPIPLVLAGGTAIPKGFLDRFNQSLRTSEFPVHLSDLRVSADPLNSTARGALMAALC